METIIEREKTEVVQSVVTVAIADEIRADAISADDSTSKVIARLLKAHYAKRIAAKAKTARRNS